MYIDVRIPWEPGKQLGAACNRMFKTVEDWGLILDWDILLLNIDWYDLCIEAIKKVEHDAGLISCLTNRIACPSQKYISPESNLDDIGAQMALSKTIQKNNSGKILDVTNLPHKLSGMFFLTRRKVWDEVGGVPDNKFLGMDNYYHDRVKAAGYHIYVMQDLYIFHNYRRQWLQKN
jgi:GT2 family glycosyltransferase